MMKKNLEINVNIVMDVGKQWKLPKNFYSMLSRKLILLCVQANEHLLVKLTVN